MSKMHDQHESKSGHEAEWTPYIAPSHEGGSRLPLKRLGLAAVGTLLVAFLIVVAFSPSPEEAARERFLASLSPFPETDASSTEATGTEAAAPSGSNATLTVESEPTAAAVLIDGNAIGVTPINTHVLAADAYLLSLRKGSYQPLDTVVVLEEGQSLSFSFTLEEPDGPAGEAEEGALASRDPSDLPLPAGDPSDEEASATPDGTAETELPSETGEAAEEAEEGANDPSSEAQATTYEEHLARGNELFLQERYADARRAYEQALEANPGNETVASRIERIDSLLAQAERAVRQHQYHRGRGDVLFEQGNFEDAVSSYKQALEYQPNDTYVQDRLAQSIEQLDTQNSEVRRRANMRNSEGIYTAVDQRPELRGGLAALHRKVNYPRAAYRNGIEGRVVVQMVVDEEGRVRDPEVIRGIGGGCDEEALRVVRTARFEPALVEGEPVPALHALWIQFDLPDDRDDADNE